jgi:hypothetical protein
MPPLDLIAWLLVALWAAILFGGLALGWRRSADKQIPRRARLASSLVLVGLAWYGFTLAAGTHAVRYASLIAAGMTLGFIGDLFMARVLPLGNRLVGGIAAFGLGHILYIAAITGYGPVGWAALLIWLAIGGLLCYFLVLRGQDRHPIRWLVLPYALLLSATAGVATGLAFQQPLFAGLAVGAVLFLISDLLIALDLFAGRRFPALNNLIWLTYGPGQALIVTSIWSTFQPGALP